MNRPNMCHPYQVWVTLAPNTNEDADDDFVEGEEEEDADADDQACHMFIFRLYKSIGSYGNQMITIYLNNS